MIKSTIRETFTDPYHVDGDMILDMVKDIVLPLAERGDLQDLRITVTKATRNGIKTVENKIRHLDSLFDGTMPKPDCLDIEIFGELTDMGQEGSFLYSLRLDRRHDNTMYASGPSKEAEAAFETMRDFMKTASVPPPEPAKEPLRTRLHRKVTTAGVYYTLLALALSSVIIGAFVSDGLMIFGYAMLVLALAVLWNMPRDSHVSWEQRMDAREAERMIDLSKPRSWNEGLKRLEPLGVFEEN